MEDFAAKENKRIKEKNLYILQLDTPRIIIITSVFFGLLVIAVLIGMNFNKAENEKDIFAEDNTLYDNLITEKEKSGPFGKNMIDPAIGSDEQIFTNPENEITSADNLSSGNMANNKLSIDKMPTDRTSAGAGISEENILRPGKNLLTGNDNVKNSGAEDILTHENIESIIPPSKILKKNNSTKKTVSRQKPVKKRNTSRKKNVVEVSSKKNINKAPAKGKDYFAVQVASYDNKSRALSEVERLEQKRYNAFIDSASVNGKKYYRVRIGPIYSKKKACNLLDEISSDNRYKESYLIKD